MSFRKLLDSLSLRAIGHRLDRRKLQEELDLHRLYLLTNYAKVLSSSGGAGKAPSITIDEDFAERLNQEAQNLGLQGTRPAVQANLAAQLSSLCHTLQRVLLAANDHTAARRAWESLQISTSKQQQASQTPQALGRAFREATAQAQQAAAAEAQQQRHLEALEEIITPREPYPGMPLLTLEQVSRAFAEAHGFTLRVAPSSCRQPEAGNGLWLQGTAHAGQIVALYPGIAYTTLHHRQIPGYPLVARTNSYLYARFDGTVLDGKPWGHGDEHTGQCITTGHQQSKEERENNRAEESTSDNDDDEEEWPPGAENLAEANLKYLEGRHPLALAHMANHPPAKTSPNVVIAAVDYIETEAILRTYFPVLSYDEAGAIAELEGNSRSNKNKNVPGAALVATRDLENEELFLNYRLNPSTPQGLPEWYIPLDPEEDARRWS